MSKKVLSKSIRLTYFTDPVCSTCWIAEPYLRKLLHDFGHLIDFQFKMGGLLPAWKEVNYSNAKPPQAAYLAKSLNHYREKYQMPMDGDVWVNDPVLSSYTPSIAFHVVHSLDPAKSGPFLRKLRELFFIQNKNIGERENLIRAVIEVGADIYAFEAPQHYALAVAAFEKDLADTAQWKIHRFPTLLFEDEAGRSIIDSKFLAGVEADQILSHWESILKDLLGEAPVKNEELVNVDHLLDNEIGICETELRVITGWEEQVLKDYLQQAYVTGKVFKENIAGVNIWKKNNTPFSIRKNSYSINDATIIGSGSAGITAAALLADNGVKTVVHERNNGDIFKGFGFLILGNGIAALEQLGCKNALMKKANYINTFTAIHPDGSLIHSQKIDHCIAVTREHLIQTLLQVGRNVEIHYSNPLKVIPGSENGRMEGLMMEDGVKMESDIFIAADGFHSSTRAALFPENKLQRAGEYEIVGIIEIPELAIKTDEFVKVIDIDRGISMGLIPISHQKFIYFLQMNEQKIPLDIQRQDMLKAYLLELTDNFPEPFRKVAQYSSFENSFLWISERMDLLPSFHRDNLVLIGDAAHPLLPFTSQGVNSALEDAICLVSLLSHQGQEEKVEDILNQFYQQRSQLIKKYIEDGDELLNNFLHLDKNSTFKIPLAIH